MTDYNVPREYWENIPLELTEYDQWTVWKWSKEKNSDGKRKKLICRKDGKQASCTNPADWMAFDDAEWQVRHNGYEGMCFAFTANDPFFFVDLDHCYTPPVDDRISARNRRPMILVSQLNSYTEISPSGDGLHVICKGKLPEGRHKHGNFEMYDAHFLCITGNIYPTSHQIIADATEAIAEIAAGIFAKPDAEKPPASSHVTNGRATDSEIIRMVTRHEKFEKLWRGITTDYSSQSEADLALCRGIAIYAGPDRDRIKRVFSQSRLHRDKWERDDYSSATVNMALEGQIDFYDWHRSGSSDRTAVDLSGDIIPLATLIEQFPTLRPPVIDGLLRQGETMNIIAAPKVGKSWLAHSLALCAAAGRKWLDQFSVTPGRVLLVDNELHPETVSYRLRKVADAMGIGLDGVDVLPIRGKALTYFDLQATLDKIGAGVYALIVVDAHYRMNTAGSENDNAETMRVYNQIDRLAAETGAAFVLIHHASKGDQSGKEVTDVGAGAGSQSRATDSHLILRPHESDGCFVLEAVTRSFPPPESIVLRWEPPVWRPDSSQSPKLLETAQTKKAKREDGGRRETILKLLGNGEWWRVNRLKAEAHMDHGKVVSILEDLADDELIESQEVKVRGNLSREYRIVGAK